MDPIRDMNPPTLTGRGEGGGRVVCGPQSNDGPPRGRRRNAVRAEECGPRREGCGVASHSSGCAVHRGCGCVGEGGGLVLKTEKGDEEGRHPQPPPPKAVKKFLRGKNLKGTDFGYTNPPLWREVSRMAVHDRRRGVTPPPPLEMAGGCFRGGGGRGRELLEREEGSGTQKVLCIKNGPTRFS